MKNLILLTLGALLLLGSPLKAKAYWSASANSPVPTGSNGEIGTYDVEYKSVVKSQLAGYSDALSYGQAVYYDIDNSSTGASYVSLENLNNNGGGGYTATAAKFVAGIVARQSSFGVATGDTSSFPIAVRGFVNYALCDSTLPIGVGNYLCVGTGATVRGKLIDCGSGVVSPILAISADSHGSTGCSVNVIMNSQ